MQFHQCTLIPAFSALQMITQKKKCAKNCRHLSNNYKSWLKETSLDATPVIGMPLLDRQRTDGWKSWPCYDLDPWKPFQQCPLKRWTCEPSFAVIATLSMEILCLVKQALTDNVQLNDRKNIRSLNAYCWSFTEKAEKHLHHMLWQLDQLTNNIHSCWWQKMTD